MEVSYSKETIISFFRNKATPNWCLCSACADKMNQSNSTYCNEVRVIFGIWVVDQFCMPLEFCYGQVDVLGYRYSELTCFDMDTNAIVVFVEYVNIFLKLKQLSSGYLSWVQTEEEDWYIENCRCAEEIARNEASISKNVVQLYLDIIKLNTLCGKGAQNENKTQSTIVESEKECYKLLKLPITDVTNFIFPKQDVALITWECYSTTLP